MGRWGTNDDTNFLSFRACMKLAQDGTMANLWLNIGHDWFTPEEFRTFAEKQIIKYSDGTLTALESDMVKLKDPRTIIPRMEQKIREMELKKKEFEQRVNDYYKKP